MHPGGQWAADRRTPGLNRFPEATGFSGWSLTSAAKHDVTRTADGRGLRVGKGQAARLERSGKPESASGPEVQYQDHGALFALEIERLGRHERLMRLGEWIRRNSALQLTLVEAARISCLEPHYFSQIFHEHVGQNFRAWRLRYRISWALHAMSCRECSLNDVIRISGYRSRRAFERAVKRVTGMTPGDARKHLLRHPLDQFVENT